MLTDPTRPAVLADLRVPAPAVRPALVAVVGSGTLAGAVQRLLGERPDVRCRVLDDVGLPGPPGRDDLRLDGVTGLLLLRDGWDLSGRAQVHQACADRGISWLPVHTELGEAVVGPRWQPGEPGCTTCVDLRAGRARSDAVERERARRAHVTTLAQRRSPLLTPLAADLLARLALRQLTQESSCILRVDLAELTVARHRYLPEPTCPVCGDLPDDTAERARFVLQPRTKLGRYDHRTRHVVQELDQLKTTYVDAETGLIRQVDRGAEAGLAIAGASMPLRFDHQAEPGYGRSRSYQVSQATAVLEALERYGGVDPGGVRSVVRGSYRELADRALDPRTCGVHPLESYAQQDFPYVPFDADRPLWWSWAHSFARDEPVLVPESLAYYYAHKTRAASGDRAHYYEVSNGCALGSCLEEAVLHGLMEVVERDAFLMTWYTRLTPPRIDLSSACRPQLPLQAAAITARTGYQVHAFDITMEHGVPAVWTVAVSPDGSGPRVVCTAGAGLDPERALVNALSELGPILTDVVRRWPQEAERAHAMAADPYLVVTMPDHSALYGAPETFSRLEFLLAGDEVRTVAQVGAERRVPVSDDDLTGDLLAVVDRFLDAGTDVLVVDQTTPEHQAGGFSCVKVIVPGLLPMTFGYRNRRVDGLPRLLEVPQRLGRAARPLHPDELNPHPHPFP